MKTQVRDAVFETNSSSSHSVTIAGEELADFGLSKEELREGVIRLNGSFQFGEDRELYSDTKSKIAYLLVLAADGTVMGEQGQDMIPWIREQGEQARRVVDLVEGATGCRLEFYTKYSFVDSESYEVGRGLFRDEDNLRKFLFSAESTLKTQSKSDDYYEEFGYD